MSDQNPAQGQASASPWDAGFPPKRMSSKRRSQKSTACENCKVKKIKCSGGPPCENCVRNGIECVVDEAQDGRRRIAVKRTIDSLEKDRDLLLDLVASMRDGKNTYVQQLLSLIRGHASLAEIRAYIDVQVRESRIEKTPELERLQQEIQESRNVRAREVRSIMDVERLSDIPVYQVPAKPWVTVTDDDELVSHLISLWFTWNNPYYNFVHRETFIRDMQAGKLDCKYCSPLLVNAILAEASALSDYVEVFGTPNDAATRGEMFLNEARRLMATMDDFSTLPTIQGLAVLSVAMAVIGKDRSGSMYLGMTRRAAQEYENTVAKVNMEEGDDSVSYALWGIFNMITTYSVSLMRYESIAIPRYPRPKPSHNTELDAWSPYPRHEESVPGHISCVSHGWSDLMKIFSEFGKWIVDKEAQPESDMVLRAKTFYKDLQKWEADLPDCMKPEPASVPQILYLHMQHQTITMQIFGVVRSHGVELDEIDIQDLRIKAAHNVLNLVNLHRRKWGIQRMSPTWIHWLSISLFTLLEALDQETNRKAFTELCVVTRACSQRWLLIKGILRMIQINAANMNVSLPEEARALFIDFSEKDWKEKQRSRFKSIYPNFSSTFQDREGENLEMDQFLDKWDKINLNEETQPDDSHE
ncbi:hypothetical protein TMatcc_007265 [Talaromyces marneffei ATCC 18224]|uniref:C6 transcription factor, putative n=1 Tax=Talaromyces marneffei (strain ATCC 18224 / CBS 334.59 / QM 7333) TaxID=441960 RepID=B6QFF7_TALMQ|nr:uncharacterized protein EYB26_004244 [Talaromyces marneffei]EEA24192.1 C6 transcription factor, putative [Talaromyces marneffei ATCC 18224]KAE8553296.1 hypothetical protein EYB25_004678 [Talaromyces marneffei]QGA16577.1 hypothetical protein EYB26_004244 [Talaromyces marneffei]